MNEIIDLHAVGYFSLQLVFIFIGSFIATIGLSYLLSRIKHHIKFIPIIILIILIYAISKIYHLPGLIFILIFGLSIGNLNALKKIKWLENFKLIALQAEVHKFKELTGEVAFLIRSLFFLVFGYLIELSEVLNSDTLIWAIAILFLIMVVRALQLLFSKIPLFPLLFVAPRGLITILLFLSITLPQAISLVNNSLITQVIILTALWMMIGLMMNPTQKSTSYSESITS